MDAVPPVSKGSSRATSWMTGAIVGLGVAILASMAIWAITSPTEKVDYIEFSTFLIESLDEETGAVTVPLVEGYQQPSIAIDEDVPVRGQRCISDEITEPFGSVSNMYFEQITPVAGLRHQVLSDFATEISDMGCITISFQQPMPPELIANMVGDNIEQETWRIIGQVQPDLPDAAISLFETEAFLVVSDRSFIEGSEIEDQTEDGS